jgi:hypothetical protein
MSAATQRCSFHEGRPAFARCMSCAKMLCQECATQWDGIWHCAACLALKRGAKRRRSPVFSWISVVAASLLLLYLGARVMVWTAAVIAGLF